MERRPVLVYDGECGSCTAAARWAANGWDGAAEAVPWQVLGPDGLAELELTVEEARAAVQWVDPPGRPRAGHLAIAAALRSGRGPRRLVGTVLLLPPARWIAAAAYPAVARRRHRLPGATAACRVGPGRAG